MKKKFYEEAEMEIVEFEVEDVITASDDVDTSNIPDPDVGNGEEDF